MDNSSRSPGFTVFAFTWAMAALFHQLSFSDWRWYDVKGIILSLAILPVLYKPSSWQRFAVFVLIDWISVGISFPDHPNHIVFSWILNGCILTSLILVTVQNKGASDFTIASAWFQAFAPWTRIMLCILYWFTCFHKLNFSYFDLEWSCGPRLQLDINERFHILPTATWARYIAMYGTVLFEAVLPVLLLVRRTSAAAIVIGFLFHGLLALHPHPGLFSFSTTMIALFTSFIPAEVAEELMPKPWMRKSRRWVVFCMGAPLLVWIFRKGPAADWDLDYVVSQLWKVGFVGFYTYFPLILFLFIRASLRKWNEVHDAQGRRATYPVLALFTLILLADGIGPYFGLRTQSSFSMFSNLHTENGVSNHLIMPAWLQVTDWQKDLVEIVDTSDAYLLRARNNNFLVVYLELRRVRSSRSKFWVVFRRNGKEETYDYRKPETYASLPQLNWLAKRYFFFRPVDRDPFKVTCKH